MLLNFDQAIDIAFVMAKLNSTFGKTAVPAGLLATALMVVQPCPAETTPRTFDYTLTPVLDHDTTALVVTLRFAGPPSGALTLDLPNEGEGVKERWRFLSDLTVTGATVATPDPATRVLTFAPGAPVTVRYRVTSAYDADPDARDRNPYKGAALRPGWFETLGDFIFVTPHGDDALPATFKWGPIPRGWSVASDLEHGRMGRPLTVFDISESTVLGGTDVQVLKRSISGGILRVAVRGKWSFDVSALADELARTISAQRDFWGHDVNGPFLVTLTPLTGEGSSGGTGRTDGFALYGTSDTTQTSFMRTIAHEHTHSWIPSRIGRLREGADQPVDYWFSEGFTDFYASRTLLRSGIWSLEEFFADMNDRLVAYTTSPVRNAPNSQIVSDFWTNGKLRDLPYQRGFLLAFIWDKRLRDAGKGGLDPVLFAARDTFVAAEIKPNAAENFLASYRRVTGDDLNADVARYVMTGATIALPADLFGSCAAIETTELADFEPGFDRDKSAATGFITGVDPDGPAYAAGLRDGMKRIKRMSGRDGDSRVALAYTVVDSKGQEQVISWFPAGKARRPLQQVMLTPGLSDKQRAACARSVSGE
jgi:predicted metalloprotease with PDZ domain